ncbi:MAG: hypothetical protein RIF39_03175, partial [Cyclobacteriaceae bacterium]
MHVYKIRIDKANKKGPHNRIVRAPSIQTAEYFAVEDMLLTKGKTTIEDHFKMGYTPFLRSNSRSELKSIFEFQSDMVDRTLPPSRVRIIRDDDAKPSVHDAREYHASIFEIFADEDERVEIDELSFFTTEDLTYFSSVIGKQFSKGDNEVELIRSNLTESGVFAKTHYWATLLKSKGFETEFRYDWQHSGRIRTYTWARVFLPELKTPIVFFTVGVGSRFTANDEMVSTLEYKLDCRRDKLSEEKIKLFDSYVEEFCPGSRRQVIQAEELTDLNWDQLIERTTNFINQYSSEYKLLSNLISDDVNIPQKLARLCWNSNGWESPSGSVGKSKSTAKSFEKEKGYGHEEWLFDIEKQIEGYHYSFLQALNKGDHEGEMYDMHLYTIRDTGKAKERYWVGRIKKLEVLTREEAKQIVAEYKQRGWLQERLTQLNDLGIQGFNFDIVPENDIFNIRFRVESSNFIRYNPYKLVTSFKKEIGSQHYVLLDKKPGEIDNAATGSFKFVEGHNPASKKGQVVSKISNQSYTKTLLHEEIKEKIHDQLKGLHKNSKVKVGTENP